MIFATFIVTSYIIGLSAVSIYILFSSLNSILNQRGQHGNGDGWGGIPLPDLDPPVIDGPVNSNFEPDFIEPVDCIDDKYKKRVSV